MGNCTPKGVFHDDTAKGFDVVRLMTDSGHILKFKAPKTAKEILRDFPGHKICAKGRFSTPLSDQDELAGGQLYYLLPSEHGSARPELPKRLKEKVNRDGQREEAGRKSTGPVNGKSVEVLPVPEKGVWKVKLAITTKQLEEILSEDANTEALIEQMRMAAAITPRRRSRVSWGLIWKPILGNVVKDLENVSSCSCKNSPAFAGARLENQIGNNIDRLYTEYPESGGLRSPQVQKLFLH